MNIPYKGYTITPNSERQADGRWVPIAELEVSYRGLATSKPPLRGTLREVRATRAEADAAAVKMAKAWIDAHEREDTRTHARMPTTSDKDRSLVIRPLPEVPSEREMSSQPTAQDDGRRPTSSGELDWASLYRAVGLHSDEQVDRLTRVLLVHSLLDRLVTVVLATELMSRSQDNEAPDGERMLRDIASLAISTRVGLVSRLGMIAPRVADSIVEVDRLRSRLLPFEPTAGKGSGRHPTDVDEIASQGAGDKCLRKGIDAVQELVSALASSYPRRTP